VLLRYNGAVTQSSENLKRRLSSVQVQDELEKASSSLVWPCRTALLTMRNLFWKLNLMARHRALQYAARVSRRYRLGLYLGRRSGWRDLLPNRYIPKDPSQPKVETGLRCVYLLRTAKTN